MGHRLSHHPRAEDVHIQSHFMEEILSVRCFSACLLQGPLGPPGSRGLDGPRGDKVSTQPLTFFFEIRFSVFQLQAPIDVFLL